MPSQLEMLLDDLRRRREAQLQAIAQGSAVPVPSAGLGPLPPPRRSSPNPELSQLARDTGMNVARALLTPTSSQVGAAANTVVPGATSQFPTLFGTGTGLASAPGNAAVGGLSGAGQALQTGAKGALSLLGI